MLTKYTEKIYRLGNTKSSERNTQSVISANEGLVKQAQPNKNAGPAGGMTALLRGYIGTLLHQRTYGKPAAIPNVDLVLQLFWLVVTRVRVDPLVRAKPEIASVMTATVSATPLVTKMGSPA